MGSVQTVHLYTALEWVSDKKEKKAVVDDVHVHGGMVLSPFFGPLTVHSHSTTAMYTPLRHVLVLHPL